MVRSCHGLNGREFEQISRDGEGLEEPGILQGGCIQPWGCKESDTTQRRSNKKTHMYIVQASTSSAPRFVFQSFV